MSQSYHEDWFDSTADPEVGFGYAEENDNACMSNFSGTASPGNTTQGMTWFKTSDAGSTVCGLRLRDSSNTAWHKIFHGTSNCRMWMYRNDADAGWIIDSSIADKVISVKASAASGYGSTGGQLGGSWTITGVESSHNHRWLYFDNVSTLEYTFSSSGAAAHMASTAGSTLHSANNAFRYIKLEQSSGAIYVPIGNGFYTDKSAFGSTGDGTWRPSAAIGTIQYPDLS